MIETIQNQIAIPVISSMKRLELFIRTDLTLCVIQDVHLAMVGNMIALLHKHNRRALIHIDMIHGLSNDEYGVEYLCQRMYADGIISTKSKVVEHTKKNKKLAIQRIFLIDSKSIERGIETIRKSSPDVVELMPAIAFNIIPSIKELVSIPMIGGGLIKNEQDVQQGLQAGFTAFTISDLDLCQKVYNRKLKD